MTSRPELRRQWREENRMRQEAGKKPLSWQEWDSTINFAPLAEHDPELAASVAHLRVSCRGGGKSALAAKAVAAGFESVATFPEPKLGTVEAAQMFTHDLDGEPLIKEGKQ